MPSKLMLVESLTKAQRLQSFLGEEWRVEATFGHVCDFPRKQMGIEIQADFKPIYLPLPEKIKILARIKRAAETAEALYIATNPDAVGEAMAWHVLRLIGLPKPIPVYRITLHAITHEAVTFALLNPTPLNVAHIEAEETRRILDRLVSYNLFPAVSKLLGRTIRVGRVESLALRLVVERERTIEAFHPLSHYTLSSLFQVGTTQLESKLVTFKGQPIGDQLRRESQVDTLMRRIEKGNFWIGESSITTETVLPPPPFNTRSFLQATAGLEVPIYQVLETAQALYEGGWITYPFTDSETTHPDVTASTRAWIEQKFGRDYGGEPTATTQSTSSSEAIRPVDIQQEPDQTQLMGYAAALYSLIWKRFVAAHMAAAVGQVQRTQIMVGTSPDQQYPLVFEASHRIPLFDGYLRVFKSLDNPEGKSSTSAALPQVTTGQPVALIQWRPIQNQTQPPARYTQAALFAELEQAQIGPSINLVTALQQLTERGYLEISQESLVPTPKGHELSDLLATHFLHLFSIEYQSSLGRRLTAIGAGGLSRAALLQDFWQEFKPTLTSINRAALAAYEHEKQGEPTGKSCPTCGAELRQRRNRAGNYLICSRYPDCSYTEGLVHQPIMLRQTHP